MKPEQTYSVIVTIEDHNARPLAALCLASGYERSAADSWIQSLTECASIGVYWDCVNALRYQVNKRHHVPPAALRVRYDVIPD